MKTYTSDGHICTDIEIFFNGKSRILQNFVIDTGAVQSILNSEFVSDIGIKAPKHALTNNEECNHFLYCIQTHILKYVNFTKYKLR